MERSIKRLVNTSTGLLTDWLAIASQQVLTSRRQSTQWYSEISDSSQAVRDYSGLSRQYIISSMVFWQILSELNSPIDKAIDFIVGFVEGVG